MFDDLDPIVSVESNFDSLLIPPDHVSRSPSDTYYVDSDRVGAKCRCSFPVYGRAFDEKLRCLDGGFPLRVRVQVLRTHTSAHQTELLRRGINMFLVCGDVYRRDEIDRSHYPVFHQMEGVRVFSDSEVRLALPSFSFAVAPTASALAK